MPTVLGIDLGTTTLTALALDAATGEVLACCTRPNRAETTSPQDKARGRLEWDAAGIAEAACACLRALADQLGERRRDLAGLGITGQQHGVVLVDAGMRQRTPLINWQDRRGEDTIPGTDRTFVRRAVERAGEGASRRAGCKLAAGYMGVTLFWMKETGSLPAEARA